VLLQSHSSHKKTLTGTSFQTQKEAGGEFSTPSKQYRLRELSPEEIASKSLRPSPVRSKKQPFSPIALFDSPLPNPLNPNQLRVGRNSCSKIHCKRCAYREQQKGGQTRRELEFQKDHDENCSFLDLPETPLKTSEPSSSPVTPVTEPTLPKPPRRKGLLSTLPSYPEVPSPKSKTKPSSPIIPPSVTSTVVSSPPYSPVITHSPIATELRESPAVIVPSTPPQQLQPQQQQQRLRAGLLLLVALLLVILLVQRNGIVKSAPRIIVAAVMALGTAILLGPTMVASRR